MWRGGPLCVGRGVKGVQHVYCAKIMLTVSQNSNPNIYNNYVVIKKKKNFRNVSNQNVNVTKRARFALFARSIGTILVYCAVYDCRD